MDELRQMLENAPVPDPGDEYWKAFPARVEQKLSALEAAAPLSPRAVPKRGIRFVVLGAAAVLLLATFLVAVRPSGQDPEGEVIRRHTVKIEMKRTAEMASRPAGEGVFELLGRSAQVKADLAVKAFDRGDDKNFVPLIRSYTLIVDSGITRSLLKALDRDEDVSDDDLRIIQDAVNTADASWRLLADSAASPESADAIDRALSASESLSRILEEEFGPLERG